MRKKKNDQIEEDQLFREAMIGVKPLEPPLRTDSRRTESASNKRKLPPMVRNPTDIPVSVSAGQTGIDTADGSAHRKSGVQKRVLQKLKRGHYPVADQLDLHTMNTRTGTTALLEFIATSHTQHLKCIRVIHGKGLRSEQGPVLKTMTRQLLREHLQVLAFTASKPGDGGDGATDVLLKS